VKGRILEKTEVEEREKRREACPVIKKILL